MRFRCNGHGVPREADIRLSVQTVPVYIVKIKLINVLMY